MKKRGSHVGFMLSFGIFVVFLIFVYAILQPAIKTEENKQALLDYLNIQIVKNVSYDITNSNVKVDSTSGCINLINIVSGIGIDSDVAGYVLVKNGSDSVKNVFAGSSNLKINETRVSENNFKIYHSKGLRVSEREDVSGCQDLEEGAGYNFTFVRTSNYVFKDKILDLINMYNRNYNKVREGLNVPVGSNFGFSFVESNGTILETEQMNVSKSVYVSEIPIEYMDSEVNILPGFLRIKVW